MKIRLASIEGRLGDPIFNEKEMEKTVEQAIKDGVKLLVFPDNSIESFSAADLAYNDRYKECVTQAELAFKDFAVQHADKVYVLYKSHGLTRFENINLWVETDPSPMTIDALDEAEFSTKYRSKTHGEDLQILCQGRGTESVCAIPYSNLKMILKNGKVLASNRDAMDNILDYDYDEYKLLSRTPYLDDIEDESYLFEDILETQTYSLWKKMKSMGRDKICLGVSGGLDSAVSLLVCVEAFKRYGMPLENIIAVTMPGLGTTERTYKNAMALMKATGVKIEEIDLKPLLRMHLKNISQPEGKYDVTFEQTQSRERTQVLLDIANRDHAIMIGTGCMSEFALGWMSYGGDHLCMYAINIGLPKTVVKMYARWFIENSLYDVAEIMEDILNGPVSPELLPVDEKGQQHEKTESIIGDYMVQDFFIYHMTVNNDSVKEIFKKTCAAFPEYTKGDILAWLEIFVLRYFTRAYKKNCYGDGVQIFSYSASPDSYHVPSDTNNAIWQKEIEELKEEIEK